MLTPADVEQKTFSTALRGYDLDEVDDFLDEVVATIRQLTDQLDEARAAGGGAPSAVAPAVPEPPMPEEAAPAPASKEAAQADIDESAIGRALVAAQTAADRLLEEAESQASRIVEEAQSEADSWTAEREAKKREAEAEISALAARVASVRSELAVLAGEVNEKLDDMDAVIESTEMEGGAAEPAEETTPSGDMDDDDGSEDFEEVDEPAHGYEDDSEELHEYDQEGESQGDDGAGGHEHEDDVPGSGSASDHLDEILTGVATDLQLGSRRDDEGSEEPDEDE